jgi:hypothetical protein
MTAGPYARLDAAYLFGALDAESTSVRGGRDEPLSQGTWLVSLKRWTAANSRPYHRISLMQAEPRYSR